MQQKLVTREEGALAKGAPLSDDGLCLCLWSSFWIVYWYQRAQSLVGSATLDRDFSEDIKKVHEHEPTRKAVNNVLMWPLLPSLHTPPTLSSCHGFPR